MGATEDLSKDGAKQPEALTSKGTKLSKKRQKGRAKRRSLRTLSPEAAG